MKMKIPALRQAALLAAAAALAACGGDSTGPKAGPPAHADVVSGNAQTAAAGTELPQPVAVKVTDAQGRPVKGQPVRFVVTAGGGHTFLGTGVTGEDGVAQDRWTLGTAAGSTQSLEAQVVDPSSAQVLMAAPFTATVAAGPPAQLSALGGDTLVAGLAGTAVTEVFAVVVRDAYGNPVPGAQVTWSVGASAGTITSPSTSDAQGIARTQWVLGSGATQVAQATLGTQSVRFVARPATALVKVSGDGPTADAGATVQVTVRATGAAGGVGGLTVQWQVGSGGGSASPATTSLTDNLGNATANWTLGGVGPQTLTATVGPLSATFTVNAIQPLGPVLDATSDRVVWLDTSNGRRVKIRTLATSADAAIKADSGTEAPVAWLFTGGALVIGNGHLFEYRDGATTWLGDYLSPPSLEDRWAAWLSAPGQITRRDLLYGTQEVIAAPGATPPLDVGPNGDVMYTSGSNVVRDRTGVTTTWPTQAGAAGDFQSLVTDGVNVGYILVNHATNRGSVYLATATGGDLLFSTDLAQAGWLYLALSEGWTVYTTSSTLYRREPGGSTEQFFNSAPPALLLVSGRGDILYANRANYVTISTFGNSHVLGPVRSGDRLTQHTSGPALVINGNTVRSP